MSILLEEIRRINRSAASVLEAADLRTDSDIQSLTREELHELFPAHKNFKLRRTIFDIIHKQKPVDQLLRELKEFFPHESIRAAVTDNGVLVDYLRIMKDMKAQMDNVNSFLDAHIRLLEEFRNSPQQESATCDPVKVHSGQPDGHRQEAQGTGTLDSSGPVMHQTDQTAYISGSSTRGTSGPPESHSGGVHPQGARNSLPRKGTSGASGETVPYTGQTGGPPQQRQLSISGPMERHTGQTGGPPQQRQLSTGTLDSSGPVMHQTDQTDSLPRKGTSGASGEMERHTGQTGGPPQQRQPTKVTYQVIVSGETFNSHQKLLEQVQEQVKDRAHLIEDDRDYEITFVFCPIISRAGSDVEAAMSRVKGDKPVILVLMNHTYEARYTTSMRTWYNDPKVVLYVNVFYHETKYGLLKCEENKNAVLEIQNKLLECFIKSKNTSGNAQGVGAESYLTGSTSKWWQFQTSQLK